MTEKWMSKTGKQTTNPVVFLKPRLFITCCQPFLNLFKYVLSTQSFLFNLGNLTLKLFEHTSRVHGSCTKEQPDVDVCKGNNCNLFPEIPY
jgi:hypothetical protein